LKLKSTDSFCACTWVIVSIFLSFLFGLGTMNKYIIIILKFSQCVCKAQLKGRQCLACSNWKCFLVKRVVKNVILLRINILSTSKNILGTTKQQKLFICIFIGLWLTSKKTLLQILTLSWNKLWLILSNSTLKNIGI
jgi:hypothetical protein